MLGAALMLERGLEASVETAPAWFNKALALAPSANYCMSDATRLHYLAWGEADINKPALMFVHGFLGHARWWAFIAPLFCQHYRVYALDFSGMGDSDKRTHYDNETHGRDILALIEHLQLDSVSVVAHSFGGGRVFRAANIAPNRFKHIIAVDSHITFAGDIVSLADAPKVRRRVYPDLDQAVGRFHLRPPQLQVEPYILAYIARHSLCQENHEWTWKFDSSIGVEDFLSYDGAEILAAVACPVDFIYGDQSGVVSADRAQKTYRHLAQPGRLIVVPGGLHHLMVSHPVSLICTLQALL